MKLFQDFYSRNTQHPQVIKQVVTQPRSLLGEIFKLTLIIATVILLSKGISYASNTPLIQDILSRTDISKDEVYTLNTLGYTTDVTPTSFTIHNAKNPQGQTGFSYTVDIQDALIKSYTGEQLSILDLKPNQQVIAKGLLSNQTIIAHTIIIFGDAPSELMATSTPEIATTTDEFATTTDIIATSTATTTDTTTSTDSFVDTVTDTLTDAVDIILDSVSGTLSNIIDTLTGTSTEPIQDTSTSTSSEESPEPTPAEPLSSDTAPIEEPQSVEETPEEPAKEPTPTEQPSPEPTQEPLSESPNTQPQ